MIEDNKINQRESLINKSNQRFVDFLHSLRKERQDRIVPVCPLNIQKVNNPPQNTNLQQVNPSEVIAQPIRTEQIKLLNSCSSKCEPQLPNKQIGDNALKYRARVNMGNRSLFNHYQFSPNWFLQTQKQLDEYLKSSRIIPERQIRENKSLNLSRLGIQGQRQLVETQKVKAIYNQKDRVGRQKQMIAKTARQRRQAPRYEDQEEINVEQDQYVRNFRVQRDTKSQYFQQNKAKLNKGDFDLDPFQSKEVYRKSRQRSNELQHCRQFSYPFGEQMPLFAQGNQLSRRRLQRRPQLRKVQLKPIERQIPDELFQDEPLRTKC